MPAKVSRRARGLFAAAAARVPPLGEVVWANPGEEAEGCVDWLKRGAPDSVERRLASFRASE